MEQDNNNPSRGGINPQHPSIANDPLLADNYNMPQNIHPERMRQMGQRENNTKSRNNKPSTSMGLPGMGQHIPAMAPPTHMGPLPTYPIHHSSYRPAVGPPPSHHQHPHASHLAPPPMQQAPRQQAPYGQPQGMPPRQNPYLSMQGGPNDNRRDYDRNRGGRGRSDRDRGRDRRDRRDRRRDRSRSRERDRKSKKGSAVPGLSRIPGLSFGK
eukprot:CAMPEP_0201579678 /NCGR_PEP_ID=MMETSP0190_2-20130828/27416_1 /ASSEMBLY_ACC=CAM_ASM_000263 /TAXON_ID=37353 /ORGANISM="Rosalina sp." /LENGTH=211 /DNA_ID=CAMNT_0048014439 /DNA_START=652 /DNA_END=1287 /DNA_ORIENTATION=+